MHEDYTGEDVEHDVENCNIELNNRVDEIGAREGYLAVYRIRDNFRSNTILYI